MGHELKPTPPIRNHMVLQFLTGLVCGCVSGIWLMGKYPQGLTQLGKLQHVFERETLKKKDACWSPRLHSWWQTVRFVSEVLWTEIEQYLCGTCVAIPGTNHYKLTFTLENRLYHLVVRPVRGPRQTSFLFASTVDDGSFQSLTEHIVPYVYGLQSIVRPLTARTLGFVHPVTRYGDEDDVRTLGLDEPLMELE